MYVCIFDMYEREGTNGLFAFCFGRIWAVWMPRTEAQARVLLPDTKNVDCSVF